MIDGKFATGGLMITILSKRIMDILVSKGWSVQYFADLVEEKYEDISSDTVKNICRGKTANPRVSTLVAMSNVLGHSVNCLMGDCLFPKEERDIINYYRQCGTHGKSIIKYVAKYEAVSAKAEREGFDRHKIPCLVPQGNIRKGIIYENCDSTEIYTTEPKAFTAIQITSNDLAPIYCEGDIILIEDRFPNEKENAAFLSGDRAYIRQYIKEDGQYRLRCLHGHGKDILVHRMDEIDYIGTCIGVVRT